MGGKQNYRETGAEVAISARISETCKARAARLPPQETRRETVPCGGESTRGRRSLSLFRGPTTDPFCRLRERLWVCMYVMDTMCVRERDWRAPRCLGSLITMNPYSQRAKVDEFLNPRPPIYGRRCLARGQKRGVLEFTAGATGNCQARAVRNARTG